jgi:hypothetical protein
MNIPYACNPWSRDMLPLAFEIFFPSSSGFSRLAS